MEGNCSENIRKHNRFGKIARQEDGNLKNFQVLTQVFFQIAVLFAQ